MDKTIIRGGFGKIKRIEYKGKPAIVKKIKISNLELQKTFTLSKMGPKTKQENIITIFHSVISTEREAKIMLECRKDEDDNIAEIYGYDEKNVRYI